MEQHARQQNLKMRDRSPEVRRCEGWARHLYRGAAEGLRSWASLGPPQSPRWVRAANVLLFALSGIWLIPASDTLTAAMAGVTVLVAMRLAPLLVLARRPLWRAVGWVSAAGLVAGNLFGILGVVTCGAAMAWTVPFGMRLLTASLVLLVVLRPRGTRGVRVPLALPMGVWVAACWAGWSHEWGVLRYDD